MKKQKKQNILTAIIIILILALIMLIGSIVYEEKINRDKQEIQETIAPMEKEEQKDNIEEQEENSDKEEVNEQEVVEDNEPKEEYIGEEEKENNEVVSKPKSNDEKAIELARAKWGNDNTVTFSIEEKKDLIYYVAIKSDATVISWYEVNVETEEVSEYY